MVSSPNHTFHLTSIAVDLDVKHQTKPKHTQSYFRPYIDLGCTFCLVFSGWNELLIAAFSHRSISVKDGILLATGLHVHRSSAHQAGVGTIFDRVLTELVSKMREMKMDKTELGCLRAIVLFNPGKIMSLFKGFI